MRVGFIGLGMMGGGMVMNIRKAGHDLTVNDLRRNVAAPVLKAGAKWADSITDVAKNSDVVFTSLPGPPQVEAVALGKGGLLESMAKGAAWFDLSTNSVNLIRRLGKTFEEKGIDLLDAPVSGGPGGAASGKLALYIGGKRAIYEKHQKLLDAIGDQAMYVGEIGAGTIAKLVHNSASFIIRTAIAEVFTTGVKAGVDPLPLWHAMRQGASGRRRSFDGIGDQFLQDKYEPAAFALKLAHKDMTLFTELAREMKVPTRLADLTYDEMTESLNRGFGDWDSRACMILQRERAGVTIKETKEDVQKILDL